MTSRRVAAAVIIVAAAYSRATAEPIHHIKTPSTLTTDGGSTLRLPPGFFLDEEKWADRDAKMKQAQEDATRFKAENESLRKSAQETTFGWRTLGSVFALGIAAGVAVTLLQ